MEGQGFGGGCGAEGSAQTQQFTPVHMMRRIVTHKSSVAPPVGGVSKRSAAAAPIRSTFHCPSYRRSAPSISEKRLARFTSKTGSPLIADAPDLRLSDQPDSLRESAPTVVNPTAPTCFVTSAGRAAISRFKRGEFALMSKKGNLGA